MFTKQNNFMEVICWRILVIIFEQNRIEGWDLISLQSWVRTDTLHNDLDNAQYNKWKKQ